MLLYIMLNYVMYEVPCTKYYLPLIHIDVRSLDLMCEAVNSITILMMRPRINMDMISSQFRFYFTTIRGEETSYGQVHSQCMIIYNMNEPSNIDHHPCILHLEGKRMLEILLYVPYPEINIMKEISYRLHRRRVGSCPICYEETTLINLHEDDFHHEVCSVCLLKIDYCPLCREQLTT